MRSVACVCAFMYIWCMSIVYFFLVPCMSIFSYIWCAAELYTKMFAAVHAQSVLAAAAGFLNS
jgi:hypothetical protein